MVWPHQGHELPGLAPGRPLVPWAEPAPPGPRLSVPPQTRVLTMSHSCLKVDPFAYG